MSTDMHIKNIEDSFVSYKEIPTFIINVNDERE